MRLISLGRRKPDKYACTHKNAVYQGVVYAEGIPVYKCPDCGLYGDFVRG